MAPTSVLVFYFNAIVLVCCSFFLLVNAHDEVLTVRTVDVF